MSEPTLARITRWGLWATAAIPLIIFSQYMSPFHFGKVVVFRSLIEVLIVLYLVLLWQDRSYRPRWNVIGWTFAAFAAAYALATFTSVSFYHSFWGTIERMGGLLSFLHYLAMFVMMTGIFRERRHWYVLFDLIVVAGVISALYGMLQKTDWSFILGSGGRARPFGTIGNAALFAGYEILCAFLAATLAWRKGIARERRYWYAGAAAIMTLAVFMTAVRGSLLGITAGAFVFLLLYSVMFHSKRAKLGVIGIVTAGVLFFIIAQATHDSDFVKRSGYLTRITDFSSQTYTVQTRFWAWEAGLKGWQDSPKTMLIGWGPENFNVPFSKHFNPKFFRGPGAETFFDRAHNEFVNVLVTMGLVGFAAYLSLFAAVFWVLWKLMHREGDDRYIGIGFAGMVVAYMIHNSFIFDTSANYITFFSLVAFVAFLRDVPSEAAKPKKLPNVRTLTGLQLTALVVGLIIATVVIVRVNVRPSLANYATTRGIIAGWQGRFIDAMDSYDRSVSHNAFGVYEYRQRMAQYLLEIASQLNEGYPEPFVDAVNFAIAEVEKNTALNEHDYLPLLYLARMHIILGKHQPDSEHNDIALGYTDRALAISPTFVRTYYEVAQAYLNKGEYVQAYEWFARAQQLNPEVGITYWYMGVTRFQLGDPEGAIELIQLAMQNSYHLSLNDTERLIAIYAQLGDAASAIQLLEQLVQRHPERAQYWSSLAVAYGQVGLIDQAVVATEKAIELDESFREEGEALIESLRGGE